MSDSKDSNDLMEVYTGKLPDINGINSIGFHVTRLKAITATRAFVAIQNNLYEIRITYPSNPKFEVGRQGPYISRPIQLKNVQIINKNTPIITAKHPIQDIHIKQDKNTQNLTISCIDNNGIISVKVLNEEQTNNEISNAPPMKKRKLNPSKSENDDSSHIEYTFCMQYDHSINDLIKSKVKMNGLYMSGFCSFDRMQNSNKFAAISHSYNLLNLGNENRIISQIHLCQRPNAVKYFCIPQSGNDSNVILVNEGNILSVWDERDCKNVKRIDLKNEMYAMDVNMQSSVRYIGCCGVDKSVCCIDPFKWNVHSVWKTSAKYELLQCKFDQMNAFNGSNVYCVGMDHDLICGEWETSNFVDKKNRKKKKKENVKKVNTNKQDLRFQHCFRADSKWIGVDYVFDKGFESMIGISETAMIYVAHKPHLLNPKAHS